MSVYDLLNDKEKQLWLDYTMSTIGELPDEKRADISVLLGEWKRQKDYFLGNLFDDSLIFKQHVNYTMDVSEKVEKFRNASLLQMPFMRAMLKWAEETFYGTNWELYHDLRTLLTDLYYYADNKYTGLTISLPYSETNEFKGEAVKTLKIQSGCKMLKALGTIYHTYETQIPCSEQDLIDFQNTVSVLRNDVNLEGDLCFSIHPLDYVTASDNECRWSSCMNWRNNGEYHRGTIEMMNSDKVIVVYLTAAEPMHLLGYRDRDYDEWSNKKWRQFFIVGKDYILPIKGYPYINHELEKIAIKILMDKMNEKGISNGSFINMEEIELWQPTKDGHEFYFESCGAMYDDFGSLNTTWIAYTENCPMKVSESFNGRSTCIWCGKDDYDVCFDSESETVCNDCLDSITRCCFCGDHTSYGTWVDGSFYCDNCYNEYIDEDTFTGEPHYGDNMYVIHVRVGDKITRDWFPINSLDYDILTETKMEYTYHDFWYGDNRHTKREYVLDVNAINELSEEVRDRIYNRVDLKRLDEDIKILGIYGPENNYIPYETTPEGLNDVAV